MKNQSHLYTSKEILFSSEKVYKIQVEDKK